MLQVQKGSGRLSYGRGKFYKNDAYISKRKETVPNSNEKQHCHDREG